MSIISPPNKTICIIRVSKEKNKIKNTFLTKKIYLDRMKNKKKRGKFVL